MKIKSSELLKDRGGHTGSYSCPVYIPVDSCKALFKEVGIEPAPKAVGVLGDILENFAINLLKGYEGQTISKEKLEKRLKKCIGENI